MFNVEVRGLRELDRKLSALDDEVAREILGDALKDGAEVIREQAAANAPRDPSRTQGVHLEDAIVVGDVKRRGKSTGVLVGVDYKRSDVGHLVEFGHGGPKPAPPHPFMRPAFDEKGREALEAIKARLHRDIEGAARRV